MSFTHMHQSEEQKKFAELADGLLALAEMSTKKASLQDWLKMNPGDPETGRAKYLREFRTVGISGKRQCGKTTWAFGNSNDNTLIVVINKATRDMHLENINKAMTVSLGPYPMIATIRDLMNMEGVLDVPKFSRVFVDDASYVFDGTDRTRFYKLVQPFCADDVLFVMLG